MYGSANDPGPQMIPKLNTLGARGLSCAVSGLGPARKTSGEERRFFDSAEPMGNLFKSISSSIWTRQPIGSYRPPKGFVF